MVRNEIQCVFGVLLATVLSLGATTLRAEAQPKRVCMKNRSSNPSVSCRNVTESSCTQQNGNRDDHAQKAQDNNTDDGSPNSVEWRVGLGIGTSFRFDDATDYEVKENTLWILNDSKQRATGIAGALFPLARRLDLLVSVELTEGTQYAIDGFLVGTAVRVTDHVSIGAAYGMRRGHELSPKFQRVADSKIRRTKPELLGDETRYDGFVLQRNGDSIFDGNPIIESTNKTLFVGLIVPLNVRSSLTN